MRYLRAVDRTFGAVESFLIFFLTLSLILISFIQIILRNFFSSGFAWSDEFTRHQVLWIGLLGMSLASSQAKHINIDILSRFLKGYPRRIMGFIKFIFSAFISAVLVWVSIKFLVYERQSGEFSTTLKVPIWYLEILFPISFSLASFRFLIGAVEEILGKAEKKEEAQAQMINNK